MLIQHPAALSENMVSLYFFLSPQRCRISHRRQCASLLHWNLTIPPSLWPDRELRKYHCPCPALTPPPVAIRHLLLRNRYRPDGLHGVQSKARPNSFDFFSVLYSRIEAKKYPVGFPTRHQRRFYSIFYKLVPVYLLVTI